MHMDCTDNHDVSCVAWSPDGRTLAEAKSNYATTMLYFRDFASFEYTRWLKLDGHVMTICWSPDGRRLATAHADETVRVYDATSGAKTLCIKHDYITSLSWSCDGTRIVTCDRYAAYMWDAGSGGRLTRVERDSLQEVDMAYLSPCGSRMAVLDCDGVSVHELASGKDSMRLPRTRSTWFVSVSWSPDGRRLAVGSIGSFCVYDSVSGIVLWRVRTRGYTRSSWSPDGRKVVCTWDDQGACVLDAVSGDELARLLPPPGLELSARVMWSPSGEAIACVSAHNLFVWRLYDEPSGVVERVDEVLREADRMPSVLNDMVRGYLTSKMRGEDVYAMLCRQDERSREREDDGRVAKRRRY